MSYAENILPDAEHIQAMRNHLILQLGLIALARDVIDITEPYEEKLEELRAVTNQGIEGRE